MRSQINQSCFFKSWDLRVASETRLVLGAGRFGGLGPAARWGRFASHVTRASKFETRAGATLDGTGQLFALKLFTLDGETVSHAWRADLRTQRSPLRYRCEQYTLNTNEIGK